MIIPDLEGRKILKRLCYDTKKVERFICVGKWANGNLAYSKLEDDDTIKDENDSTYVQCLVKGNLDNYYMMFHI